MKSRELFFFFTVLLAERASAQSPSPDQLAQELHAIIQRPLAGQTIPLSTWKRRWEKLSYKQDSTYVKALLQIGLLCQVGGKLPAAAKLDRQAVLVCRANPGITRAADLSKALYRLGTMYSLQNLINDAINVLKQAVTVGQNDPESATWVGNAYLYLAYAYETKSDYQQTITYADAGLQVSDRLMNKALTANLLRQKAQALNALQQYGEARQTIEQAIRLIRDEKSLTAALADNYSLLSIILGYMCQHDQALAYASQAFDLAQRINYNQAPSFAIRLSFLHNQTGNYDKAISYGTYATLHSTDPFKEAEALRLTGVAYWKKKRYIKAIQFYQRGMMAIPLNFQPRTVEELPTNNHSRIVAHKEILLTLFRDKADTWLDYARVTHDSQRLRQALQTYQAADQMIDFMRWEHSGQESKLNWRNKTRGLYERAIETCYRLGDTEQAFRFLEKSRAAMLADKLNELGARQQLSPQQVSEEQRLRERVSSQQSELAKLGDKDDGYAQARASLFTKQDSLDAFLKQLEATNPAYYRYKYDTTTTKLADLKSHLANRKASFVTYFVGDSALYLLAVTGDKTTLHQQSIRGYNQTAQEFMALLADPVAMNRRANVAQFLKLGNRLYRQLLAPLNLPEGSVIVSSDESSIPFEALSRSAREPDYLVKSYAFSYEYSARRLLRNKSNLSRITGISKRDFLGVAPVTFAAALKQVSLPGSDQALKPIAARFGSSVLLTGSQATSRAFVAEAADSRVIQLFTHATADTTNSEPLLYFADATLRLSELGDGALTHTQLAVLAACKTGVGANQRGEGVFSLARGFAALGVPSVLTTLWSVENEATYEITKSFYKYLDEGLPKDVALQRAKQEWLSTAGGADQLPNAWAGLILVGDTEPLSRPVQWAWVVGGILLVLGAGGIVLWWRRRHWVKQVFPQPQSV